MQLKIHHRRVWRSMMACGLLLSGFVAGQAFTSGNNAEAYSSSDYSRVNQHCVGGISFNVAIDLGTAAQIEAMPAGTSIDAVAALVGDQPYCWLNPKTSPSGVMSEAFVLPIWTAIPAPPQVLIVYSKDNRLVDDERWGVAPPDWRDRVDDPPIEQAARSVWSGAVEAWQNRDRSSDLPVTSIEPSMPQQSAGCPPCPVGGQP
ncbi:hypothetical protein H6F67_26210 [Microcoleus sp. FACHB-1515]|uniref:hypothetical protein n=1 Tax=Cyanophyceae TaxID=3028117 RepID=UPI0016835F73|nr:hypothetical protein [Microcoleus sp. FACHB-1515]MBD2093343.1 hypothetical protein [Microcoleus sp. FACHB-1515]